MRGLLVRLFASRRFVLRRLLSARNGLLVVGLGLVLYGVGGVAGSSGRWAVVGGYRQCVRLMPAGSMVDASAGFVRGSYRAWVVSGPDLVAVPVGSPVLVVSLFGASGRSMGSRVLSGGASWRLPLGGSVLVGSSASVGRFSWLPGSCSAA